MNNNLHNVTRTLRDLIKTLPAVKARANADLLRKHLQLIAHFQRQYDQIVANSPHATA